MSDVENIRKGAKRAYKAGQFGEAAKLYAELAVQPAASPDVIAADRLGYASALTALNRLDEASVQIEHALEATPDEPRLHFKQGEILSRLGRHGAAAEHFAAATRLEPTSADSHWRLALELRLLGREAEFREELQRCLAINPDHTEAQLFQLEQLVSGGGGPYRDGQAYEAEDVVGQKSASDVGPSAVTHNARAPTAPTADAIWRARPLGILVEAVMLAACAILLKAFL